MRLFIFGSCVSRDAFDFPGADVTLVNYVARTSLASQLSAPYVLPDIVEKLPSKFQREMMMIDMGKTLFGILQQDIFDLLFLDFIDERFSIGLFDGARLSLTQEFVAGVAGNLIYSEWNRFSEEKFSAWKRGFDELIDLISLKANAPLIVINKVYFAAKSGEDFQSSVKCERFMDSEITRNNKFLNRMYNYVESNYKNIQFITYDDRFLVAKPSHKWGLAPFHYIDDLYFETLRQIMLFKHSI